MPQDAAVEVEVSGRNLNGAQVEITMTLANGQKLAVATTLDGDESLDARQLQLLGMALHHGALYG